MFDLIDPGESKVGSRELTEKGPVQQANRPAGCTWAAYASAKEVEWQLCNPQWRGAERDKVI